MRFGFKTPTMQNQMEKNVTNEMESGFTLSFMAIILD